MTTLSPALYALRKLHAELGGQIQDNKRQAERLADDMRHVEAVIKMLDPEFNVRSIAPKRRNKPNPHFKKGTFWSMALGILRDAPEPITSTQIIIALLKSWGIEPTPEAIRQLYGAANSSLRNHRGKTVERIGDGRPFRWRVLPALVPLPISAEVPRRLSSQG